MTERCSHIMTFIFDSTIVHCQEFKPNKPDAANPAIALWLTIEDRWRRVADLERSPTMRAERAKLKSRRRVLRNQNGRPLILRRGIDVVRFAAVQKLRSNKLCLGSNCSINGGTKASCSRAKFRNNTAASTSSPKHQVSAKLFRNCEFSPRRFFSKDWQGSIHERVWRSNCCAGRVLIGIKPRSVSWCAGG